MLSSLPLGSFFSQQNLKNKLPVRPKGSLSAVQPKQEDALFSPVIILR